MNKRDMYLDALKGVSILMIILVHSDTSAFNGIIRNLLNSGARGVQMFFIISTVLLLKSFDISKGAELFSTKKWILKKIIRFIPLYYLTIIVYLIIPVDNMAEVSALNIVSHFLFLHGLNPYWINSFIAQCWYLGTLAILVVLTPLISKLIKNIEAAILFWGVSWIFSIVCQKISFKCNGYSDYWLYSYYDVFSFISELPVISIGIIIYLLVYKYNIIAVLKDGTKRCNHKALGYGILLVETVVYYVLTTFSEKTDSVNTLLVLYSILFGLLLVSQEVNGTKIICNRLFATMGKYSYGIFLSHVLVIREIKQLIGGVSPRLTYMIVVVGTAAICLILSWFFTNYFEKPMVKVLDRGLLEKL